MVGRFALIGQAGVVLARAEKLSASTTQVPEAIWWTQFKLVPLVTRQAGAELVEDVIVSLANRLSANTRLFQQIVEK